MAAFGTIGEFNGNIESWTHYVERLEQFFIANDIKGDERQRAVFLTVVGPSTYGLLRNLLSPDAPTSKSLEDIREVLNKHFSPVPSEIVERFKFNSRARRSGESVADFIAELRRLAKYCNYGVSLDMMLRDRIVCGIQDEAVQRKLLSEVDLTLVRATDIALSMETAARNTVDLRSASSSTDVCRMQYHPKPPGRKKDNHAKSANVNSKNLSSNMKCFRCGDLNHLSADCKFIKTKCHACRKIGHIAKICQSKGKFRNEDRAGPSSKVNKLQAVQEEVVTNTEYTLFNLNCIGEAPPPVKVECIIAGKQLSFEVDSGARFTLMPLTTFRMFKHVFPPLQETTVKLQSYTKHAIDILGVTNVDVTFHSKVLNLPLLIVKQGNVNLAGRNWIYPLHMLSKLEMLAASGKSSVVAEIQIQDALVPELSLEIISDKYKQLFSPDLGLLKGVKVHLARCSSVLPKFFKARPVPYALRDKVDRELDRLLQEGIIEPVKTSEWAAPIVPVLKQDGRVRICGDFKLTVNQATDLEQYPLPKIEDLFAQLSGGEFFSKLDLRDAYCQLELDAESRDLVVINTQRGLFRYTRLPFGVASAPAIFQREIDKILQGQNGASCYLDDLLVSGRNKVEHLKNLDEVLSRLEAAGIRLHPTKCEFLKHSVEYLGHRIDKQGLHPVEAKLDAIDKAPSPTNVAELRSFLGLITYYAKFLPNMATLLAPLYKLLEIKQPWDWSVQQEQAFSDAKEALKNSSLLVHFDNNKEVILACDASPYGLGAVLSHKTPDGDRPIAFASRSLTKAERNYSQIEKETLALVFGVTRFRNYVLGRTFTLVTDHRPLINLLSENKPVPVVAAARIQRWALTLSAYAYKIQFRKGELHGNADACSRLPLSTTYPDPPPPADSVLRLEELDDSPVTAHLIKMEVQSSSLLRKIQMYIQKGWPRRVPQNLHAFWLVKDELSIENGVIFRGSRVFIPQKFRKFILDELHVGHQGISAIKAMARSSVWWPKIDSELEAKVKTCVSCQENASSPPTKSVSWPLCKVPWERIHIDHAGPVEGHMLLLVIDSHSKWLEVIPVPSTSTSATMIALHNIFARFGLPQSLVSDNGPAFTSAEFRLFLKRNGITHIKTAPYHPNSNGLAERSVRTVKSGLRKITEGTFYERLARFLFAYRRTPLAATGKSPAMLMLGRSLRSRLDLLHDLPHPTERGSSSPCT